MSVSLHSSDVRRHLSDLGYPSVPEEQLQDFIKDLKRLIKYEEKEARRAEQTGILGGQQQTSSKRSRRQRRRSECSTSSAYSSSSSQFDEETHRRPEEAHVRPSEVHMEKRRVERRSSRSESVMSTSSSSSHQTSAVSSEACSSVSEQVIVRVWVPERSEPDFPSSRTRRRSVSEPRRFGPPTTSFIRPSLVKPKTSNLKTDPVRLHNAYRDYWKSIRLPGDGSDKNLRWAVREWMMGPKE